MPHWDSTISALGSKDPFVHHNVLVSSATAPTGIIAKAFKPVAGKWAGGRTLLFPSCSNLLEGSPRSAAYTPFLVLLCETALWVFRSFSLFLDMHPGWRWIFVTATMLYSKSSFSFSDKAFVVSVIPATFFPVDEHFPRRLLRPCENRLGSGPYQSTQDISECQH